MNIALLGTGTMGKAIVAGLLRNAQADLVVRVYDKNPSVLKGLDKRVVVAEPASWFGADVPHAVIVAVKPADIASAISMVTATGGSLTMPLWISIAAGTTIASLAKLLPDGARICRVMPNTPALIGQGMSSYSLSGTATENDAALVENIFAACGRVVAVPENLINAVTGLSGSGPAYVFLFIESLVEAGIVAGLPRGVAAECALQTVQGAAAMAAQSPESIGGSIRQVMTPAGPTARGISVLEQHGMRDMMIKTVVAATRRAEELEK